MMCRIGISQIQPRKRVPDHADYSAPTPKREKETHQVQVGCAQHFNPIRIHGALGVAVSQRGMQGLFDHSSTLTSLTLELAECIAFSVAVPSHVAYLKEVLLLNRQLLNPRVCQSCFTLLIPESFLNRNG